MSGNFKNEDLRIQRTYGALMGAMSLLLERRSFTQLTVNDLCEEAQISRSTFYAHFVDKYDLLKCWLENLKSKLVNTSDSYKDIEKSVNAFVNENPKVIMHLIERSNAESYELLSDFMISLLDANIDRTADGQIGPNHLILSIFLSGGMMHYLYWQAKNRFPEDLKMMNPYFFDILNKCLEWIAERA